MARRAGGRSARKALRAAKPPTAEQPVHAGFDGGQYRPLTDAAVERIHRAALHVLEHTGVADPIGPCAERITAAGGWLNHEGRLCFPPALVEDMLATVCRGWVPHGHEPARDLDISGRKVRFGTAGAAVNIIDFESSAYRDPTLADLYDITRLADYTARIARAYPKGADGTTLFPFRRLFIVATR